MELAGVDVQDDGRPGPLVAAVERTHAQRRMDDLIVADGKFGMVCQLLLYGFVG